MEGVNWIGEMVKILPPAAVAPWDDRSLEDSVGDMLHYYPELLRALRKLDNQTWPTGQRYHGVAVLAFYPKGKNAGITMTWGGGSSRQRIHLKRNRLA